MAERTTLGALGVLVVGLSLAALAAQPGPVAAPESVSTADTPKPRRAASERGGGPRRSERPASAQLGALRDRGSLDPNLATAGELELLPGIGPALAARIVEDRVRNGPYRAVRELGRVHGIGERRLATLERLLAIGSPARSAIEQPHEPDDGRDVHGIGVESPR